MAARTITVTINVSDEDAILIARFHGQSEPANGELIVRFVLDEYKQAISELRDEFAGYED